MPPLTLNQAAREAGKSKSTLLEAIRGGRLSATKDGQGHYQIDPAELFRVWPPTGRLPDSETATAPPPTTMETALLRQQVAFLERILLGVEDERDDLRRRLDAESAARESAAAEIRRLTLMITHQREPKTETPPTQPEIERQPRPAIAPPLKTPRPRSFWDDIGDAQEIASKKVSLYEKLFGRGKS